ncbi:hypothetical protein [Urechidicola croceus]|uniref:Phytase-like domain-containing protein n=1 Tax=Urechidicola croceus TaxID=1850246 RepID=A0A1D8P599_9FLAO|nr:hypothetical protein [Urechidicola croceus]AOW19739.1 hypothetical protein LPB138_03155 [Urechidicola croceus]
MKKLIFNLVLCGIALITISATNKNNTALTANFIFGDAEISSINVLSFGPEGILFIGDSKNASIYALDTKDISTRDISEEIDINNFDTKIAASLGTTTENIKITDMAVNPISKTVYFSVNTTDGTPVLLKLNGDTLENVSLKKAHFSKIALENAVGVNEKDHRGREIRHWAIADMKYHNGNIMVSGLSNKEFKSTFRSIPFPFSDNQDYASLEVYHAAHGRYETYAPIKAFDIVLIENKEYLLASYTCTPLVLFPIDELNDGKHIKGRTVAELGAGNSPLDMIHFERDGKPLFFMSNTNRPVMRIKYDNLVSFKESMTEPVEEFGVAAGLSYDNLPFVNVLQMDNLDEENVLLLKRDRDGNLSLKNRTKQWM